jgi:hypothetical protein
MYIEVVINFLRNCNTTNNGKACRNEKKEKRSDD